MIAPRPPLFHTDQKAPWAKRQNRPATIAISAAPVCAHSPAKRSAPRSASWPPGTSPLPRSLGSSRGRSPPPPAQR